MAPELERARYIDLVTFRKDGRAVTTPVWCVAFGGKLYCYTHRDTGKAKRIRGTGRVQVAVSGRRGNPLGPFSAGTGRIITEPDLEQRVYAELAAKYGWKYRLLELSSRLGRRRAGLVTVELTV